MAEGKRESIPGRGRSKRKGSRTNCGQIDAGCCKAKRVGGRAERSGRSVFVQAVRKIDRSKLSYTFVRKNTEFVSDSFLERQPVKRAKEQSYVV